MCLCRELQLQVAVFSSKLAPFVSISSAIKAPTSVLKTHSLCSTRPSAWSLSYFSSAKVFPSEWKLKFDFISLDLRTLVSWAESKFPPCYCTFHTCLRPQCYNRKNSPGPWGCVLMMTPPTSGTFPPQQLCKCRETLFYWLILQKIIKHANQGDCKPTPLNLIIVNLCLVPAARSSSRLWLTSNCCCLCVYELEPSICLMALLLISATVLSLSVFGRHRGHSSHKLSLPSKGC